MSNILRLFYTIFGNGDTVYEYSMQDARDVASGHKQWEDVEPLYITDVYKRDPLVVLLFWLPAITSFLFGGIFVLRTFFSVLNHTLYESAIPIAMCFFIAIVSGLFAFFMLRDWFLKIRSNEIAIRQITENQLFLTNTIAFLLKGISETIILNGDIINAGDSTDDSTNKFTTICRIRQDKSDPTATDYQKVEIFATYRLNIHTDPQRTYDNYGSDFGKFAVENAKGNGWNEKCKNAMAAVMQFVKNDVSEKIAASMRTGLAHVYMDEMIGDEVLTTSENFFRYMRPILQEVGIELIQLQITKVEDTHPNGWLAQNARISQGKLKANADMEVAKADRAAREVEANENLAAVQAEQIAQQQIAVAQLDALREIKKVDRVQATINLLQDAERMKLVDKHAAQVATAKLLEMSTDQVTQVLSTAAESIAFNPDTIVNLGVDPVRNHPLMAIVEAIFKTLGINFTQGSQNSTPPASPPAPGTTIIVP